ncbi:hypothetical protein MINT15_13710 [Saccharomonospora viridis]|jgi:hypothetical protein|uniref:Uncharacterized protein n=2 Tax=Saccharomonospora viridis TaxID=1852 RepID=C7MRB2_SACVD|nr:hypothetical protein Svir_37530 [Saccharomonospora viridis DSM 43017]KHF44489.1 hypothetical protein MINT15_13710 [Saccharomonospora viridis]
MLPTNRSTVTDTETTSTHPQAVTEAASGEDTNSMEAG